MDKKIKASELFEKLVNDTQKAMASEDPRIQGHLFTLTGNKKIKVDHTTFQDVLTIISKNNEYLRFSMIKSIILTLSDLNIIENDVNINDTEQVDKIINTALNNK